MKKKSLTKKDQTLAGLIFILWSFGIIFTPYANTVFTSATTLVKGAYLFLHILVFLYTLRVALELVRSIRPKQPFNAWVGRAALYGYVLIALTYSMSLLLRFF